LVQQLINGKKPFALDQNLGLAREVKQLEKDGAAVDFKINKY
tara:strand:+ start:39 stop:164 length:126 start_codon:yes stop_codon:yes gene_type:complete